MTEGKYELFKLIVMIGLIITMIVLSIVIYNYTKQMKLNPCDLCETKYQGAIQLGYNESLFRETGEYETVQGYSGTKDILNTPKVMDSKQKRQKEYVYIPIEEVNANLIELEGGS